MGSSLLQIMNVIKEAKKIIPATVLTIIKTSRLGQASLTASVLNWMSAYIKKPRKVRVIKNKEKLRHDDK